MIRKRMERGVISFPKCGRTWIRLFFEYYKRFNGCNLKKTSKIVFRHNDDEFIFDKRILLIRHPCDVMVSYYIHQKMRRKLNITISEFIRSNDFGIPFFNKQYSMWSKYTNDQYIVRYEDMFEEDVWKSILNFFNIPIIEDAFNKAIKSTKFKNIRKNLNEIKTFPSAWRYLAAECGNYNLVEPKNSESHKFRRGKVKGYVDYLNKKDIKYILNNFTLGESLNSYRKEYAQW